MTQSRQKSKKQKRLFPLTGGRVAPKGVKRIPRDRHSRRKKKKKKKGEKEKIERCGFPAKWGEIFIGKKKKKERRG